MVQLGRHCDGHPDSGVEQVLPQVCGLCTTHLSHQHPIGVESLAFPLSQGSFILLHKFLGLPG